jgi:hypothetical protein
MTNDEVQPFCCPNCLRGFPESGTVPYHVIQWPTGDLPCPGVGKQLKA